jgi:undecaprenyl-diphosphatase
MDILELIKYIVLGMIQGFTEPLPISSSGHLVLFQEFLGIYIDDLNFEIIVNAGSLIAIIIVFRKDIIDLIRKTVLFVFKKEKEYKQDFMYVVMLVIAVIPAGVVGFLLKDVIEDVLKNVITVGISLLITSIALNLVSKEATENEEIEIKPLDALIIGVFQVFALIPGISRSGSTMVGGLTRKIKFEEVMKFSFLLYIPISLATIVLGLVDLSNSNDVFVLGYISAFIASIVTTYFAVLWFFQVVRKGNLKYFSIYCMSVGIIVLVLNFVLGGI